MIASENDFMLAHILKNVMERPFARKLHNCRDLSDIFELVKLAVDKVLHLHRAGLTLGLADLGEGAHGWIGGYHILSSNAIIMNRRPLYRIEDSKPNLYKPYAMMLLTHEYIHSLGIISELQCRKMTLHVLESLFGRSHLATEMARDIKKFLPEFRTVRYGWVPPQDPDIIYVTNFDRSSMTYYS